MAFSTLVAFDRPLAGALLPGTTGRLHTDTEVAEREQAAYHRGIDAARAAADQQMVEMRADMAELSSGVLQKLGHIDGQLTAQLREALPGLAVEIARRLLAGYEPPADVVGRLCAEALEQLFPERDGLELSLCPRDAALLADLHPEWMQHYPGLRIRQDATLTAGDCVVRSRFGLTDARQSTKLASLTHSLTGA